MTKLPWPLNLGLQALLFLGFVFFQMLDEPAPSPKTRVVGDHAATTTAPRQKKRMQQPDTERNGPYPNSSVDALLSLDGDRQHLIGIAHLDEQRVESGYHMSPGAPPNETLRAFQKALESYETLMLLQAKVKWVLLVSDYTREGEAVIATGGSAKHGMIVVNFGSPGGPETDASHLHHELWWRIERTIMPSLKTGWPKAKYSGDYSTSRRLFVNAPSCYVSEYATSHPVADRAEIYRAMVSAPQRLSLKVAGDECLANKVSLLKSNIRRYLSKLLRLVKYQ